MLTYLNTKVEATFVLKNTNPKHLDNTLSREPFADEDSINKQHRNGIRTVPGLQTRCKDHRDGKQAK